MAKGKGDEIPEISPLARQQPPGKVGGMSSAGKLSGEDMSHEKFTDKMTKSLCK